MISGVLIGLVAGYFGGWIDGVIMRAADLVMAFPDIILAMAVVGYMLKGKSDTAPGGGAFGGALGGILGQVVTGMMRR